MKKRNKLKALESQDPAKRKEAIEDLLKKMDEDARKWGDPLPSIKDVNTRLWLSSTIILWTTIIGTVVLAVAAFYFSTLPRPYMYASTQEGKLHVIQPYKIEQ